MPRVSVALPIHRLPDAWGGRSGELRLSAAFAAITGQTLADIEILLLLNGADERTRRTVRALAATDARARVLELPEANLARALNHTLRTSRAEFVARMDADDLCPPQRLEMQVRAIGAQPGLDALGCVWDQLAPDGAVRAIVCPPSDPRIARWRLLLGNTFAHGSMLLRREAILRQGGYDAAHSRAQDYDLWLRLSRSCRIAAIGGPPLYTFHLRDSSSYSSSPEQARHAAAILTRAWSELPSSSDGADLLAAAFSDDDPHASLVRIESALTTMGPSKERLQAWLYVRHLSGDAPFEPGSLPGGGGRARPGARPPIAQNHRVLEAIESLKARGVGRLHLWGAGAHTANLLPLLADHGLEIVGLVDDFVADLHRFGLPVRKPDSLTAGEHVLLSSDRFEERLWHSAAAHRRRGVVVHGIYLPCAGPSGLSTGG